ncbi:hypothetical protein KLER11_gp42 [Pararheinheimera phage vB_PsoM_KLER1-1]|nr:hypothetical protein KLER11_gp42 [Pararheinheimera phage vB_PsoM_KLER1-1]
MNLNERMNQLIAENERLKAEIATANSMHVDAIAERDALAAQVKQLHDKLSSTNSCIKRMQALYHQNKWPMAGDVEQLITSIEGALLATPQHHMTAHDAEVAAKAVEDVAKVLSVTILNKQAFRDYAAQLRAKAGDTFSTGKCLACGEDHGSTNLPCPKYSVIS